jgi:hypothetical protein
MSIISLGCQQRHPSQNLYINFSKIKGGYMKKQFLILVVILVFFSPLCAVAEFDVMKLFDGFESKPISYKLTGIASSGTSILLWGNVGEIMRSTDLGNSWHRVNVSSKIIDYPIGIEYVKNKYIGVLSNGSGIISMDDGKTWQIININETERIFKMFVYQDKIFYMTPSEFKIYDDNFQLIKAIPYQIDTNRYEFVVANNYVIYPIGNGKIGMINVSNQQTTVLKLDSLNICQDCTLPTNFLADNDYFYFILLDSFYRYSFQTGKISSFAKPSTQKNTSFVLNNGSIYQIFSKKLGDNDSLYFHQLISGGTSGKRINATGFDRRVRNSVFKGLKFINNNIIIGVGTNKLICKSTDGGTNWKIISVFNPTPPLNNGNLYIFDSLNVRFIDDDFNYYYTTNGGITWLSTKQAPKEMFNLFKYDFYGGPDRRYFSYFFDSNTGISVYSKEFTDQKNICYTNTSGETLSVKLDSNFVYRNDTYQTLPYGNKLLVFTNNFLAYYGTWFIVWEFDKDLRIVKDTFRLYRYIYRPIKIENQIVAFSVGFPPKEIRGNESYWIIKSSDGGITWDSIPILQNYWFHPDTAFFKIYGAWCVNKNIYYWFNYYYGNSYDMLYHFNPETNKLTLIDSMKNMAPLLNSMFELRGKFYLCLYLQKNWQVFDRLYIFDSPTSFQVVDLAADRIKPRYFVRSLVNPNLFVVSFFDTLSQSVFMLLMNDKGASSVEEQKVLHKQLELSEPYPQPAKVRVKARVAWDGSFDLREAIDGVYDTMGRKVEGKERIRVDARSTTSGELEWECSGVPAGIYFILIRWRGGSETVPVVVE